MQAMGEPTYVYIMSKSRLIKTYKSQASTDYVTKQIILGLSSDLFSRIAPKIFLVFLADDFIKKIQNMD